MPEKPEDTGSVLLSFEPEIHDLPGLATSMYMAVQGFSGGDQRQKDGLARLAMVLEERTKALYQHWNSQVDEVRKRSGAPSKK